MRPVFSLSLQSYTSNGTIYRPYPLLLVERDNAIRALKRKILCGVHIGNGNLEAVSPPYTEKPKRKSCGLLATGRRQPVRHIRRKIKPRTRLNCLTLLHFKGKQTDFTDIQQSRPLIIPNHSMRKALHLSQNRQPIFNGRYAPYRGKFNIGIV